MANVKVREKKQLVVDEVSNKLKQSVCTIIADYRGLNVAQVTELRKQLRDANVEFQVVKNSLARRAAATVDLSELDEFLVGPTAIAYSNDDLVAPAKILSQFAKSNAELELRAGVLEGDVVTVDQIKKLAELPSREGLLSMLLSVLQAPVRNFALAVKAVSEKE